jgi:hypothetical protein
MANDESCAPPISPASAGTSCSLSRMTALGESPVVCVIAAL